MHKGFFDYIRIHLFNGSLSQQQVDGINALINAFGEGQIEQLAYLLGTVFHETDRTMQPLEEYGKGKGMDYGKKLDYGNGPGKRIAYISPNKLYYGRGHVQITWLSNYKTIGALLSLDLVNQPELLLSMDVSAKAAIIGMRKGLFTGHKLSDYINEHKCDFVNARRIINGVDCAIIIKLYAEHFLKALKV